MEPVSPWPWGLLPIAAPLVAWIAWRLGVIVHPQARPVARLVGGAVWGAAFFTASVRILAFFGVLRTVPLLVTWGGLAAVLAIVRPRAAIGIDLGGLRDRAIWPSLVLGALAVGYAALAAYWLPVWQWDSLGYHLPYVQFVLQDAGTRGVPIDVPYLSTYPHNAELLFAAMRLLLPDDRLIDLGQIPFGILGALGVVAVARQQGARSGDALVAGALFLTVPAVFLQLPTNYVDVAAAAYFLAAAALLLAEPTTPILLAASVAIGLFLGTKPSAPVGTTLLALLLLWRARQAGRLGVGFLGISLIVAFGGEAYLDNLLRHGNPIWPVEVRLGPIHLPGNETMQKLLSSGAAAPKVHGPLPLRVLKSWTSLTAMPVFDMRVGGFGPLVLAAIPLAAWTIARSRTWALLVVALAAVVGPDPAVARYVLAFPGLVLATAVAAPLFREGAGGQRAIAHGLAAAAGAWSLYYASPGLIGEGPPLRAYARMSWEERADAVGANGRPTSFLQARARLGAGEGAAYDLALDLPYLLWRSDGANRVVRIPNEATPASVEGLLEENRVRLLVAGRGTPAEAFVRQVPHRFVLLFPCKSNDCLVYWRL